MVSPGDLRPLTTPENRDALDRVAKLLEMRNSGQPRASSELSGQRDGINMMLLDLAHDAVAALLEALPASIAVSRNGVLAYANAAFAQSFGYVSADQLENAGGLDAVFGSHFSAHSGACLEPKETEVEARSRTGRVLSVPIALRRVETATGQIDILIVRDDTLRRVNAAPSPNESGKVLSFPPRRGGNADGVGAVTGTPVDKLDFLAKVSHEVRTPLNSIIGFAEMMREGRLGAIENVKYRGYIDDIHASGLYALSLINDLLDISKVEAGRFELDFAPVHPVEVVEESVKIMHPQARRSRIVLRTTVEPDLPLILADRRRLKQILLNLLSNAIKFTEAGGHAVLSVCWTETKGVRIRVRDSGVGMSDSDLTVALEPFRQLATAPSRQIGTGLGLPLTKALAEANRASFSISSEPNVGTVVDVCFPPDRVVLNDASKGL